MEPPAMTLVWILLATFFGGVLSAALASLFLLLSEARRNRLLPHLISFATGAMLAAALIGLLPEAIASVGPGRIQAIGAAVLAGIALFFVLEKLVLWRHCHTEGCETHSPHESDRDRAAGWIVLFGDGVHNAFDGVLIAAAFPDRYQARCGDHDRDHRARDPAGAGRSGGAAACAHEPGARAVVQRRQQPDVDPRRPGRGFSRCAARWMCCRMRSRWPPPR